jgi:hypothetical protein
VDLYISRTSEGLNDKWVHFAQLLKLPALEETLEGYVTRQLDMSEEGELRVTPPPASHDVPVEKLPPMVGRVEVAMEGDITRLSFNRAIYIHKSIAIMMISACISGIGTLLFNSSGEISGILFWVFNDVAGVLFFMALLQVGRWGISREVLEIGDSSVKHYIAYPWGPMWKSSLPRYEIKDISVRKDPRHPTQGSEDIRIESKHRTIVFDAPLSDEHKILIKNYLVTRLRPVRK